MAEQLPSTDGESTKATVYMSELVNIESHIKIFYIICTLLLEYKNTEKTLLRWFYCIL